MKLQKSMTNNLFPQSSVSDIAFLLMIFFILTTMWATPKILNISSGSSLINVKSDDIRQIHITTEHILFNEEYVELSELEQKLETKYKYRIMIDDDAIYENLVKVLDCFRKCGINKVQVMTDET